MEKQLKYTTAFVVVLLLVLGGALYLLDTPGSNQLTSATVATHVDCSVPVSEYATSEEREMYNKVCDSKEEQ